MIIRCFVLAGPSPRVLEVLALTGLLLSTHWLTESVRVSPLIRRGERVWGGHWAISRWLRETASPQYDPFSPENEIIDIAGNADAIGKEELERFIATFPIRMSGWREV